MSDVKNMHNELSPHLQRMLAAYGQTPERDPELARRTQASFMAELDKVFVERTVPRPGVGGAVPSPRSVDITSQKDGYIPSIGKRTFSYVFITLIVLAVFFLSAVGTTAYAASLSLPGDALYPFKTTTEIVRARLTPDAAAQARLYLNFAGQRLVEMQALIREGRFADMDQAARQYEIDLQRSLRAVETVVQHQPGKAAALRQETLATLQDYGRTLTGLLNGAPSEAQSGIQNAIHISTAASASLDAGVDEDDNDGNLSGRGGDDTCLTPSPGSRDDDDCETPQSEAGGTATPTPQPPVTPTKDNSNNNSNGNNSGGDDDDGGNGHDVRDDNGGGDDNGDDDDGGDDNNDD